MNEIRYYALDENEEVPYEFVVIRNVNGEPKFYASFVNTNTLTYGNGVLLKLHERNDELRAENAKLRKLLLDVWNDAMQFDGFWDYVNDDGEIYNEDELPHYYDRMRELGVEVD